MKLKHLEDLTDENISNLKKLADYLINLDNDSSFDMDEFYNHPGNVSYSLLPWDTFKTFNYTCGYVACAVGHGPAAGILPELDTTSWNDYALRSFGFDMWCAAGEWCFGSNWSKTDNTPGGAAKRIYWFLKNGVPEGYHYQISGHLPLCYRDY